MRYRSLFRYLFYCLGKCIRLCCAVNRGHRTGYVLLCNAPKKSILGLVELHKAESNTLTIMCIQHYNPVFDS